MGILLLLPLFLLHTLRKIVKRDCSRCSEFTRFKYREQLVERILKRQIVLLLIIGGKLPT